MECREGQEQGALRWAAEKDVFSRCQRGSAVGAHIPGGKGTDCSGALRVAMGTLGGTQLGAVMCCTDARRGGNSEEVVET